MLLDEAHPPGQDGLHGLITSTGVIARASPLIRGIHARCGMGPWRPLIQPPMDFRPQRKMYSEMTFRTDSIACGELQLGNRVRCP